jgi:hypothetical protein
VEVCFYHFKLPFSALLKRFGPVRLTVTFNLSHIYSTCNSN